MLTLPIYYTQEFKTKPSKTFLVGMNWYRNAFHFVQNKVKTHYNELIYKQVGVYKSIPNQYRLEIHLYYKNASCDGSNIFSMMEKFTLDALQELSVVTQDNVKYHDGTSTYVKGQDKDNPRVEIFLKEISSE